jgi:DNA-binding NarL/FixJ family response regulator
MPDDISQLVAHPKQLIRSDIRVTLANDEIAQSLAIGVETVKDRVQNMLRKMDVRDRTQAAVSALTSGPA